MVDKGFEPLQNVFDEKETEQQQTTSPVDDWTMSIEKQYKLLLQKGYKAMLYWIWLFVLYFIVSTYTSLLNYDVIVNSSVIDSLANTSSTLIKGTAKEQQIGRTINRLGLAYTKKMAETFKPTKDIVGIYCIDKEKYIQNAISYNSNTQSLYNNAFWNAGGIASSAQYNQQFLSNMTSAISLMLYEACGNIEGNIYIAKMNTIKRKSVDADIININIANTNANSENYIASLMAYRDKKIQSWFINNIKDENSNLIKIKEKYLTLSVAGTAHKTVDKNWNVIDSKNENISVARMSVVPSEDFFFKYPVTMQKIWGQQMKTDKLATNEYVTWIKIFAFNMMPQLWLLGVLGSIKYALNAFLYIWPVTSLLFWKYVFLTITLMYIGFCIILLEIIPQLIFIFHRMKLIPVIMTTIEITTKFVYQLGMVLIFIAMVTNLILPLLWIFF